MIKAVMFFILVSVAPTAALPGDWQTPDQLPPAFRNHCTFENFTQRPYCSFGCCHLGHGYCDWNGVLRCHP